MIRGQRGDGAFRPLSSRAVSITRSKAIISALPCEMSETVLFASSATFCAFGSSFCEIPGGWRKQKGFQQIFRRSALFRRPAHREPPLRFCDGASGTHPKRPRSNRPALASTSVLRSGLRAAPQIPFPLEIEHRPSPPDSSSFRESSSRIRPRISAVPI